MKTTSQTNDLVLLIDGNRLEQETAKALQEKFMPFFQQASEWKEKVSGLVVKDINETDLMQQAREARLVLRDLRVQCDKTRKELKEDSLRYGQAVQSVYNMIEAIIKPMETHLKEQEDFVIIQETKIKDELRRQRNEELQPYAEFVSIGIDFGNMTEDDYKKFLNGCKLQLKDKQEKEALAIKEAAERQAKLEAEQKAQAEENARLKKEKEDREAQEKARQEIRNKRNAELRPYAAFITDYDAALNATGNNYQALLSTVKDMAEKQKAEDDRIAKEHADAKAKADALAKELADKKAAEEKAAREAEEKAEQEASAKDIDKFSALIVDLTAIKTKYTFKSKKYQKKYNDVKELINKIVDHVTK